MSTLRVLEDYLVGEKGYLLSDSNKGKTIMLSGDWGSGKTHFWLEVIKPKLIKKEQKNIYISLYGRESINELKFEVLKEAYNLEVKEDFISKSASMLSTIAPSFGEKSLIDGFEKLNKKVKMKKAKEILKSGSIICLDDFERKSSKIDLNDLFGYISQLAIDYECKVIIILNSNVFEGKEANVFKAVKEKTVNKFLYFEPSMEELFETIFDSNENYKKVLENYKEDILKAIRETKELNARIYIQVLDNCLEWLKQNKYDLYEVRTLILTTVNFIKHHFVFEYSILKQQNNAKMYKILEKYHNDNALFEISNYFIQRKLPKIEQDIFEKYLIENREKLSIVKSCDNSSQFLHRMNSSISKKENTKSESYYERLDKVFQENKDIFLALYTYAYLLDVEYGVCKEKFDEINQFVKTGIISNNFSDTVGRSDQVDKLH